MEPKKMTRRVSVPNSTDRKVHFQRGISIDNSAPDIPLVKKVLARNNTVAGITTKHKPLQATSVNYSVAESFMGNLIECPICLERLSSPKMLPCQHTFCQGCLQGIDKGKFLTCPTCNLGVSLTHTVAELPPNLYLNSLLTALEQQGSNVVSMEQTRCAKCQTVGKAPICQHCQQMFCLVCWPSHVAELRLQLGSLCEQLHEAGDRLQHRTQEFKDQCEKLHEHIEEAVETRIAMIRMQQESFINEAREIESKGEKSANDLQEQLQTAESNISFLTFDKVTEATEKVNLFLVLHRTTSDLLNEVSRWNEARPSFDHDAFCINYLVEKVEEEEEDEGDLNDQYKKQALSSPDGLSLHYRSRNFNVPRMSIDRKVLQRPAGVGIPPWNDSAIYVAGTDNRQVSIIDRVRGKLLSRLTAPDMLCPQGLAFSSRRIYVTDKWNHRIHVFDKDGTYLMAFGKKGNGEGQFRSPEGISIGFNPNVQGSMEDDKDMLLYICDTGNDRLQVLCANDGSYVKTIGILKRKEGTKHMTELNQPTGVAVTEHKIVVTDCGNRVRVYSLSGVKMLEFGSHGGSRGQFRSPECVAVDRLGFILVGDSGNRRVQIFRPNGNLVQIIGGNSKAGWQFGWISGLMITENMDIIVTDCKNHNVQIF